ncbi:ATP-grasp fold amidoligase family protein [Octadecabacter sp. R77987]|uniref:ATP-grasp fold amidoligase family protein n=1 Tax=Octadecabacter sp. R77987 TaxID=3093874 RepID=UPI003672D4B4
MSGFVVFLVRWAVLLRHPRLSYWYRKVDRFKRLPNPANPMTMNDKYYWRKIFDRSPEFIEISDKLRIRGWLEKNQIHIDAPAIIWTGKDPSDMPGDVLARGVVVKVNHGSGTNIILHDAPPDRASLDRQLRKHLRKRHGRKRLEWRYFGITPKLLVETFIPGLTTEFKVYTFGDRIERLVIIYDRFTDELADVWLPDGQGGWAYFGGAAAVEKRANRPLPVNTHEALEISRQIGRHFDHMRVDILSGAGKIWFSEFTIYNMGGYLPFVGDVPDEPVNTSWDLCTSWFLSTPQTGWRKIYANSLRDVIGSHET